MIKIIQYSLKDLLKSRWIIFYTLFYFLFSYAVLTFGNAPSKGLLSIMNVVVVLTPLISILLSAIYIHNSREFITLLLSQPLKRAHIFLGLYISLCLSQCLALTIGLGIPFILIPIPENYFTDFLWLILNSFFLTVIFAGIGYYIVLATKNKVAALGLCIFVWLFLAIVYDGIFMLMLYEFRDYPLEYPALGTLLFNPIDLSRTSILLKLEISALLGYTGAVFKKFFDSDLGTIISLVVMMVWSIIPLTLILLKVRKKDF
ncbi:MAG: ABC transporter permease [Flavobacteriales bacterium]